MSKTDKPRLSVDWDGCLSLYENGWQGAAVINDSPTPGAMKFLASVVPHFTVCIFSSRSHQPGGGDAMRRTLLRWLTDALGEGPASQVYVKLEWPLEKPAALVAIDDRAIQFQGVWPSVEELLGFKPWNRRPQPVVFGDLLPSEGDAVRLAYRKAVELAAEGMHTDDAAMHKRGCDAAHALVAAWPSLWQD